MPGAPLSAASNPFVRSSCATEPGGLVMTITVPLPPSSAIIASAAILPPLTLEVTTWLATNDGSLIVVSTVISFVPRSAICRIGRVTP